MRNKRVGFGCRARVRDMYAYQHNALFLVSYMFYDVIFQVFHLVSFIWNPSFLVGWLRLNQIRILASRLPNSPRLRPFRSKTGDLFCSNSYLIRHVSCLISVLCCPSYLFTHHFIVSWFRFIFLLRCSPTIPRFKHASPYVVTRVDPDCSILSPKVASLWLKTKDLATYYDTSTNLHFFCVSVTWCSSLY